ncbi:MAG: hypothetical protein LR011_06765, partial [Verrucomicrobia bacterium]|nr:hypothetical protein [Verrucomicrobiota bacterium]
SNIANVLLILGLCACIYPLRTDDKSAMRDGFIGAASGILLYGLSFSGIIALWEGAILSNDFCSPD